MNELLDGLVPGLNQAVKKTIISRADGIPLYAVETVRMLVAQGKLTERDGAYLAAGEIDTIAIPETLTALIAARLDGVGPDEKSVLQAAAVLGQSFSVEALEALSGRSAADLAPMLVAFTRREVLSLEADPRSPERGQYSFVQALIREVAYNQLARNERKQRHLAAARWFESLGDDELAGVLAEHYAAAYKHAPDGPEADALAGQARIALRGAAERAAKLGSHAQAARYLMQALELTDEPTEQAALLERAGNEETDIDAERGQSLFERAVVLYRSIGDLHGLARAAVGVSITMMLQQRPVDAAAMLEPVVAETSAIADEPEGVFVLSELVRAYANSRHPDALKYVDQVLQRAEELEMMPIIAEGLINRALVLGYAGRFYEPATILRGVLPITQKHGLVRSESRTLNNLSVLLMAEDISESERLLEAAVEMSRRTGALALLESFQAGEIYPLMLLGRFDEAKSLLAVLMEAELTVNNLEVYQVASMYYALIGDRERASTVLSQTRPVADAISLKDMQVAQLWTEAFVSGVIGNYDESYRAGSAAMKKSFSANAIYAVDAAARTALWMNDPKRAREAALAADELKFPGRVFKAMLAHARATADAMDGNTEQALASYRALLRNYADLQLPLLIAWAKTDMAVAIGPSVPEAAAAADEARAMWADFGASGMLARMDEVMQRWPDPSARRSESPVSDAVETPASA
jgi:tetratricopeptide (TPR) repeat protein